MMNNKATINPKPQIVVNEWVESKKGWVYERKRHLIFAKQMIPRWMVLYTKPLPSIALYEQRSDAKPPYTPLGHYNVTEIIVSLVDKKGAGLESVRPSRSPSISSISDVKNISDVKSKSVLGEKLKELVSKSSPKSYLQICSKSGNQKALLLGVDSESDALDWIQKIEEERLAYQQSLFRVENVDDSANKEAEMELLRLRQKELSLNGKLVVRGEIMEKLTLHVASAKDGAELESLLGEMNLNGNNGAREAFWNEAWNYDYLKALALKRQGKTGAADLDMERVKAEFTAFVVQKVTEIVDSYHKYTRIPSKSTFGPIQIEFIANYDSHEETFQEAEQALKNEIVAQAYVNSQNKVPLLTALMTLVEYKGFQMLGYFALPLDESNCVYDVVAQVKDNNARQLVEQLAKELYLGAPYSMSEGDMHYLHPTVQLHRVSVDDGEVYPGTFISNLHLLLPKYVQGGEGEKDVVARDRRIRPELLQRFKAQLGCDDLCYEKTAQIVDYLHGRVLEELLSDLESLEELPTSSLAWTRLLHSRGINCCLLGVIAKKCKLPHIKEQLAIEMIARAVKQVFRIKLREAVIHFRQVQALKVETELQNIALAILNEILNKNGWSPDLQTIVEDKFGFVLDAETFRHLPRMPLFLALQHHCLVEFEQREYDFERPLSEIDFVGFKPRALHNDLLEMSGERCVLEITKALNATPPEKLTVSQRTELSVAFLEAIEQFPGKQAELLKIAENLAPPHSYSKAVVLQNAVTRKLKSLSSSPNAASLRHALTDILNTGESARNFAQSHLGEHHPACFLFCMETSDLCWELAEKAAAMKQSKDKNHNTLPLEALQYALNYRQEALALAVKVLGRLHKVTKELVVSLGSINKALANYQEAIGFFLDALKTNSQSRPGWLLMQVAECQRLKGDNEEALDYTLKAKQVLENSDEGEGLLDDCLQHIAELAQDIYPGNVEQEHTEVLGKEARDVLDQAADAYEALFERLRSRPDSIDGDNLIRILKRLISLKIRLAAPAERTVIHAIRSAGGQDGQLKQEDDVKCKDMLVRMVTINSASQHISRILEQGTALFDRKLLQNKGMQTHPAVEDLRTLVLIADTPN